MRALLLILIPAAGVWAQMWPLERLYSRPFVWGTRPEQVVWAKRAPVAAFLWNEEGNRFLDLYAVRPGGTLRRLTRLEALKDDLWLTGEDKDARRRNYKAPPEGLSAFRLSEDGSQAAFVYQGDLFTVGTDGARAPKRWTRTRAAEASPRWSPDGRKLATLRGGQIHVLGLTDGVLWQVTDLTEREGVVSGYEWSPDGTMFAVLARKGSPRRMPLPNYSGRFVEAPLFSRTVAGDEPSEWALYVIPAAGGELRPMKPLPLGAKAQPGPFVWSPDSRRLLWSGVSADNKRQQIAAYEAATGGFRVLTEDSDEAWVFDSHYDWSPDGREAYFNSERGGYAHWYAVRSEGGGLRQITSGAWESRGEQVGFVCPEAQWREDGWIYFNSNEGGPSERHFWRVRPDGSGKEKLSREAGLNCGLASHDGKHVAMMRATLDAPFELYLDGERVTRSPRPEFASIPWPRTEFVSFPSRGDGKTVHAKLLLPPGYRAGNGRWPCVFFIHGAGIATSVLKQWGSYSELRYVFNAWLASQGYVVMDLDYRGSTGYGRDWRTGVYLHMGGKDLDDVLGAVDYLRGLRNVDMGKLGIWGVSYGGFMTNMAMFLSPDTFRAGASWAAVNDWENYNQGYTAQRLNTPASNPEAYRRSSPVTFSQGLKNPLLVIHGMGDSNVLFQDAVQLTEKLVQEGKPVEHFYYPQEDHAFVREETLRDAFRRTAEFLARRLK